MQSVVFKFKLVLVTLLSVLLTSSLVFAANKKVLVISDVDDTLKVSHILAPLRAGARVANFSAHFTGMSELFQLLQHEPQTTTQFIYLSNAPAHIAGYATLLNAHRRFLHYHDFPVGTLSLRDDFFERDHKITEIRKLIRSEKPDAVLFIGDNGERDTEIYEMAVQEFRGSGTQFFTFIHQLYKVKPGPFDDLFFPEIGKKLRPDQVGFVTPIEIAIELNQKGMLSPQSLKWIVDKLAPSIARETFFEPDTFGSITFPSFKKCQDFVWRWPLTAELQSLVQKIKSACR